MLKRSRSILFMSAPALTLLCLSLLSFICLASTTVSAEETFLDNVDISVPVSCNLNSSVDTAHRAVVNAGTSVSDIGTTNFTVFCNDASGFALYAIGYTNEDYGDNTLVGQTTSNIINTGQATSGDTSAWAMKMVKVTDGSYQPNNLTITNNFNNYSDVPDTYTKVAEYTTSTDATLGSKLQSTYRAFISTFQDTDTYNGKVKYTLVHPYTAPTPVPISKNLYYAITGSSNNYTLTISDSDITSGAVASGPVAIDGYTLDSYSGAPTTPWYDYYDQIKSVVVSGTVAPTSTSAWFASLAECGSWNLSGLKTDNVTDMASMFNQAGASSFTLDLSSWNTSNVTNMQSMFAGTGYNATTWSISGLSNWDTSNVTNMAYMFYQAGYSASSFVLDLSSWNTSNVTDMQSMFAYTGYNATTWSVGDLSNWDTSKVTNMNLMFDTTGYNATTWSVGDLSGWDTSSVIYMNSMFSNAGRSASSFSLDLSSWNTFSAGYMNRMFYRAGYSASSFSLDISFWNTSSVINMSQMFYEAGNSATAWSITIPKTNNGTTTGSITNTTSRLYGKTTSAYATPLSGKSFTLAN